MTLTDEALQRETRALRELTEMSNWGRWGPDDERGAANHVTAEAVLRAAIKVRLGRTYSLGLDIRNSNAPLALGRPAPQHFMVFDGGDYAAGGLRDRPYQTADDAVMLFPHGSTTHVDALCHVWAEHRMYNGISGNMVRSYGATRLGIENLDGLVTRGILLDVPAARGINMLDATDFVYEEDLLTCLERQKTAPIEPGDAVLVRTGWTQAFQMGPQTYGELQPGLAPSAALTLAKLDVSVIGADNVGVQAHFHQSGHGDTNPREGLDRLHVPLIRNLGIYLVEMLDLEEIARDKIYDFLFCLAPLRIKGATASPVNPLAIA